MSLIVVFRVQQLSLINSFWLGNQLHVRQFYSAYEIIQRHAETRPTVERDSDRRLGAGAVPHGSSIPLWNRTQARRSRKLKPARRSWTPADMCIDFACGVQRYCWKCANRIGSTLSTTIVINIDRRHLRHQPRRRRHHHLRRLHNSCHPTSNQTTSCRLQPRNIFKQRYASERVL